MIHERSFGHLYNSVVAIAAALVALVGPLHPPFYIFLFLVKIPGSPGNTRPTLSCRHNFFTLQYFMRPIAPSSIPFATLFVIYFSFLRGRVRIFTPITVNLFHFPFKSGDLLKNSNFI